MMLSDPEAVDGGLMKTQILTSAFDQEQWLHNKPMICNDCGENQSDGRKPDSHVVLKDQEGPDPGTFLLWGNRGATSKPYKKPFHIRRSAAVLIFRTTTLHFLWRCLKVVCMPGSCSITCTNRSREHTRDTQTLFFFSQQPCGPEIVGVTQAFPMTLIKVRFCPKKESRCCFCGCWLCWKWN